MGGDGPCAQIEPYFAARIKTLAQLRISCSPKSTPAPLPSRHSPVTVTRRLPPTMSDASPPPGINGHHVSDSPAVDSPATPVDNTTSPDIKIDVDYAATESDARHELVTVKMDTSEDASLQPQVGTPTDPGEAPVLLHIFAGIHRVSATIPIAPPKGTPPPSTGQLLEDVRMAEEALPTEDSDVHMADIDTDTKPSALNGLSNGHTVEATAPTSLPAVSSIETAVASTAPGSPYPNNTTSDHDDDKPPPAKRARKYSDAERASLANVSTLSCVRQAGRADGVV